jgi:signal transduction histidine kinase
VLGVRLFDAEGGFQTGFPPTLVATNLAVGDVSSLRALQPVSRFHECARLTDYFLVDVELDHVSANTPLLEVTIPLHARGDSNLVAAAQLLLDGQPVAREYARVDGHLWQLGLGLYGGGAALLSGVLFWAYRRLGKAHALVEERTMRLLRAHHELALAAKTSALGSVTAHLIHGLSNPLANLQGFVADHRGGDGDDLELLKNSTQRMQQLVTDVVRMLGEERGGEHYQITLAELAQALEHKMSSVVSESGVRLVMVLDAEGNLVNRHANLVLLILENLIHNALKVTPRDRTVSVRFLASQGGVRCEVADGGPGLAEAVLPRLFTPCRSTQGGSGLGLAISKQLANQLGAELELKVNTSDGCVFALSLPASIFSETELTAVAKF